MNKVENIDVNKYKITFSVGPERFEEGLKHSYNKNKKYFNVQGFRKGKVPRKIVELNYGKEVLYEEAFNFVLQDAYPEAVEESELEIVSKPEIDVESVTTEEGVVFIAEVYVKPEVKLGEYKGLEFTPEDETVTDQEVLDEIEKEKENHARMEEVTDRPIQNGDIATIDFEGFMDGIPFEGGKGTDHDLEIGSNTFIDTFEEQLIGKSIGDDLEVNVTFPEEYGQKDLAGKQAKFMVEVKNIHSKEYPEINDEFVQDTTEFESLDDYKKDVRGKLEELKKDNAKTAKEEALLEAVISNAEMDVPEVMIENEIDNKIREFQANISRQGLSLDMYLQYMGQSIENMREAYRIISEKQVKGRLVLDEIAKVENIEVSEDEISKELDRIAEAYGMEREKIDAIFNDNEKEGIIGDIKAQKALELIDSVAVAK